MYCQTIHLTHELKSLCKIMRGRINLTETPWWKLLAVAKTLTVTLWPRLLALQPFLRFGHNHGPTQLGPIQVTSTQREHFSVISRKRSGTQCRLSQKPVRLEIYLPLICLADKFQQRRLALGPLIFPFLNFAFFHLSIVSLHTVRWRHWGRVAAYGGWGPRFDALLLLSVQISQRQLWVDFM